MEKIYKYICMCIFSGKYYIWYSNNYYKKNTIKNGYEMKECYLNKNNQYMY